jgi:hypothetical protein
LLDPIAAEPKSSRLRPKPTAPFTLQLPASQRRRSRPSLALGDEAILDAHYLGRIQLVGGLALQPPLLTGLTVLTLNSRLDFRRCIAFRRLMKHLLLVSNQAGSSSIGRILLTRLVT